MLSAIEKFGARASRLHLDVTALKFAGAYEDSALVHKGWGADGTVSRQVQMVAATSIDGVTLYCRAHPGEEADVSLVAEALERLAQALPPGLVVCADSAFGRVANLCAAARSGVRFVVPLRANTGFMEHFLRDVGHAALKPLKYLSRRQRQLDQRERTTYRGTLRPYPVVDPETGETRDFRVAYIWSSEEATSVAEARDRALEKAEKHLQRIRNDLQRGGRHYKTQKQVADRVAKILEPRLESLLRVRTGERNGRPTLTWRRDEQAIAAKQSTDGIYALATNLPGPLSATRVLRIYKDQSLVELAHRDVKQTLRVRPVFLHNDERIEALVAVVGLALLVFGLIQADVRARLGEDEELEGLLPEGRAARPTGRNIFTAFSGLGLTYTPSGIALDPLTSTQQRILDLLQIEPPWPVRQLIPTC
jgi:transposase